MFLELCQAASLLTSGLFFGLSVSFNLLGIPSLQPIGDPRQKARAWLALYEGGKLAALSSTLVIALSSLCCFFLTLEGWYLAAVVLVLAKVPFTYRFMEAPINHKVKNFALNGGSENLEALIQKWVAHHWLRTLTDGLTFFVLVWTVVNQHK